MACPCFSDMVVNDEGNSKDKGSVGLIAEVRLEQAQKARGWNYWGKVVRAWHKSAGLGIANNEF